MIRPLALVCAFVLISACGDFPRDSEDTLRKARQGTPLRVGYTVAEPWVRPGVGEPGGVEAALVKAWARQEGLRLEWVPGGESQLVEGLHGGTLDLAVGGFTDASPHGARIGTTQPYLKARLMVGAAPGAAVPERVKGQVIGHDPRRPDIAAAITKAKAEPVSAGADASAPLVAFWEPELGGLELASTDKTLLTENRVIATAPAENALTLSLDRFLHRNKAAAEQLLAAEARR